MAIDIVLWHNAATMMLNTPPSPQFRLAQLGAALRRARKSLGRLNSEQFGKAIGVSGRSLRALEASGKGSTENLVRALLALCPEALEQLISQLEQLEPPYASVEEALNVTSKPKSSLKNTSKTTSKTKPVG